MTKIWISRDKDKLGEYHHRIVELWSKEPEREEGEYSIIFGGMGKDLIGHMTITFFEAVFGFIPEEGTCEQWDRHMGCNVDISVMPPIYSEG